MAEVNGAKTLFLTQTDGTVLNLSQTTDTQSCSILSRSFDMGKVDWSKFIDQIFLQITDREAQVNLFLNVYTADDDADENFVLTDTISVWESNPLDAKIPDSRFFRFELVDVGIQRRWKLSGFRVFGELVGQEY